MAFHHTCKRKLRTRLDVWILKTDCNEFKQSVGKLSDLEAVKIKVKLSLCLTKHYAMKTSGGVDVKIHAFLTTALVGEWSASRSCRFTPRE
jgi:hypothetical protein